MKGQNRSNPSDGKTKHKHRPRPKYRRQWASVAANKLRRAQRQADKFGDFAGLKALKNR